MLARDADSFSTDRLLPPFRPILAKYCLTALSMTRLYNKRLAMSVFLRFEKCRLTQPRQITKALDKRPLIINGLLSGPASRMSESAPFPTICTNPLLLCKNGIRA